MGKSTKRELSKFLKQSSKADLEKEVKKLYDKFSEVKNYYETAFTADTTKTVKAYKNKIYKEYFKRNGAPGKGSSNASRKVITDFKKIATFPKDIIELLLYRVAVMLDFASYSDLDEAFYNSLTRSFDEACQLIANDRLEETFKNDCEQLMNDAYTVGWGVYGAMEYSYSQVM
ncbi:MAG: DUF6155 family protein [Saprospiraceae bacterium]